MEALLFPAVPFCLQFYFSASGYKWGYTHLNANTSLDTVTICVEHEQLIGRKCYVGFSGT